MANGTSMLSVRSIPEVHAGRWIGHVCTMQYLGRSLHCYYRPAETINMFQSHVLNLPYIAFDNSLINPIHYFPASLSFDRQSRL